MVAAERRDHVTPWGTQLVMREKTQRGAIMCPTDETCGRAQEAIAPPIIFRPRRTRVRPKPAGRGIRIQRLTAPTTWPLPAAMATPHLTRSRTEMWEQPSQQPLCSLLLVRRGCERIHGTARQHGTHTMRSSAEVRAQSRDACSPEHTYGPLSPYMY